MSEVDESVSHIAAVTIVDWKVEEVVSVLMVLVELGLKLVGIILVRNISDHNRCSGIQAFHNVLKMNDHCRVQAVALLVVLQVALLNLEVSSSSLLSSSRSEVSRVIMPEMLKTRSRAASIRAAKARK